MTYQLEYNLLEELTPLSSTSSIASAYGTLMNPILSLFSTTLTSLISLIKRSLHKYTFLALASFEHLLSLQNRWDDILSLRSSNKEMHEFKEGLLALRSQCLRSFPEFLVDIKMEAIPKPNLDLSTGLAEFVVSVCASVVCEDVRLMCIYDERL